MPTKARRLKSPPKEIQPGVQGSCFARTGGKGRHVTIYPLVSRHRDHIRVDRDHDFSTEEADIVLKENEWHRATEWRELEPMVFQALVVKQ